MHPAGINLSCCLHSPCLGSCSGWARGGVSLCSQHRWEVRLSWGKGFSKETSCCKRSPACGAALGLLPAHCDPEVAREVWLGAPREGPGQSLPWHKWQQLLPRGSLTQRSWGDNCVCLGWVPAFHLPCLAHRWFPGLECPFRRWEKHNKCVGKVTGKAGRGEEADFCPGVGGWGCGVHSWLSPTHLQHNCPERRAKESFSGHLGRAGPGPGSTGWMPGAHPQLWSVLEPLPSALVSPSRNHSHWLGKPHLWAAGQLKSPKQSLPSPLRCLL